MFFSVNNKHIYITKLYMHVCCLVFVLFCLVFLGGGFPTCTIQTSYSVAEISVDQLITNNLLTGPQQNLSCFFRAAAQQICSPLFPFTGLKPLLTSTPSGSRLN